MASHDDRSISDDITVQGSDNPWFAEDSINSRPTIETAHEPGSGFRIGSVIMNRYKVISELGRGGMGVVYKCFDETAGVEVALKALPPELSHNPGEMEYIRENFQLVHNLHHPNIASSNNLEKDERTGDYYLIMECCSGEDLRRWIRLKRQEAGILTPEEVLPIIRQIASALDYAHEEKILHRDIKPGNVMVDFRGKVKVLDFGLAAQIHSSMSRVSQTVHGTSGTPSYMAPEQWRGRVQDAAADQYALAVIAYEMLAGHLPFDNPDPAVLKQAVLDETPEKIANVPQYIQSAIFKALSKTPDERFSSCTAFADALENKTVPEQKHEVQLKPEPTPAKTAPSAEYYDLKLSAEDCEKKFNERNFQTTAEMNKLSRLIKIAEQRSDFPFAVSKLKELIAETEKVFAENAKREEEQKQLSEAIQNVEKIKENFRKKGFKFSPKMLELKRLADEAESRQDFESAISLLDDLLKESETVSVSEQKRVAEEKALSDAKQEAQKWEKSFQKSGFSYSDEMWKLKTLIDASQDQVTLVESLKKFSAEAKIKFTAEEERLAALQNEKVEKERLLRMEEEKERLHRIQEEENQRQLRTRRKKKIILTLIWIGIFCIVLCIFHLVEQERVAGEAHLAEENRLRNLRISPADEETIIIQNGVKLEMMRVHPGNFTMSKNDGENDSDEVEHPKKLLRPFYIGKFEVTNEQWCAVMSVDTPPSGRNKGAKYPVENITWFEAMAFCKKLNQYAPNGWKFILPTETQWEFAARGGNKSRGYKYSGSDNISDVANTGSLTQPVGSLAENELGLYDMSGNVWEWCLDNYTGDSRQTVAEFSRPYDDPGGSSHVMRGGSWISRAQRCRLATRRNEDPAYRDDGGGFRVALVPVD